VHACGHEGAGIGLAAATGHLIAQALTGAEPDLDLTPFRPDRFAVVA
jgi:glycine/D-amino acid oxidase-like deaminating enzyme